MMLFTFNPKQEDGIIAFNPLNKIAPKYHHLVASGLISTFKKIWSDTWGPRLEYILRSCLLTLLWFPEATLLDIQPLLTVKEFRQRVLEYVQEHYLLSFWQNEYEQFSPRLRSEAISPILNKVGMFTSSVPLRKIFGTPQAELRLQKIMDNKKILLVNLSKGELGESASSLIGSVLITSVQLAAMHRSRIPEEKRISFFLFVDESHSFLTESVCDILSEARKFRLGLCMVSQYLNQLPLAVRNAIFGNVGTLISFRVGSEDAKYLSKVFSPEFDQTDLISLPRYSFYLKLMIDGATSKPFSARSHLN